MRSLFPLALVAGGLVLAGTATLGTSRRTPQETSANDFLQKVADHELRNVQEDRALWTYERRTQESGRELVTKVIQTRQGDLDRLPSVDGKPLSKEQREKETTRLQNLVANPQEARKLKEDRERDAQKAERLLSALPTATMVSYGEHQGHLIELDFKPNPGFHPTSHETQVLHAMSGTIWVNTAEARLSQIDGWLINSVKFGGGLLGHLDKGGEFHVTESEVRPGQWEVTRLRIDIKGKALFFKEVGIEEDKTWTNFVRVADDLSLAQAAKRLDAQVESARR